jgi:hypothetical protein
MPLEVAILASALFLMAVFHQGFRKTLASIVGIGLSFYVLFVPAHRLNEKTQISRERESQQRKVDACVNRYATTLERDWLAQIAGTTNVRAMCEKNPEYDWSNKESDRPTQDASVH